MLFGRKNTEKEEFSSFCAALSLFALLWYTFLWMRGGAHALIVVVAEKPSVGRDIARVLQCKERGEGCIQGNHYLVTWAMGHLVTLCEPDEIDEKYKKWRMEDLPILPETIPTKVIGKTKTQFNLIKKWINAPETEKVICATDAGREGELIFRLIYQQAKCQKPVERLWISSMTDEAIREGFAQMKSASEYEGLYRSATCRAQADWLVGMNASRAFTLRFDALLSIGRVQTPTLAILVKRHHEIANFKPEEYSTVTASFGDYSGQYFDPKAEDEKKAHRIQDAEEAKKIAAAVKGKPARVESVEAEEKKEGPPQLYDLTSLQREANRKLGFTADKTLKVAQELYEKWKAVTYPRTDSRYLPMDMIGRTKLTLQKLPEAYQSFVKSIPWKEEGKLPVSKRIFDNAKISDHHAIIPTPQTAPLDKLPADAARLFDMIARRTIAVFYPFHEYESIRVVTLCQGYAFKTTGKAVRVNGWKDVYPADEKGEDHLPALKAGDERVVDKAIAKKETTKPPAPHTDASLLAAMENAGRELEDEKLREQMKGSGLGTPATRAAIIERLIQVGYASRRGRAISATEKGVALIAIAPEEIASPETTGKWELALDEIAKNQRDTERFMQGIRNLTAFLIRYAKETDTKAVFPEEMRRGKKGAGKKTAAVKAVEGVACPLCGKPIQENSKAFGCSAWREGCHFTLWKNALTRGGGPLLSEKLVRLLLQQGAVQGSTGVIRLQNEQVTFTPKDAQAPSAVLSVIYRK